jgi:hypothetical protein
LPNHRIVTPPAQRLGAGGVVFGVGYLNNAHARQGAVLALMLVAGLLAVLLAAATPARALELGISDSDSQTLSEPFWDGLGLKRARIVLPYDVAMDSVGPAGRRRRADFDAFRAAAAAKGVTLLVAFAASADVRAPDSGDAVAPTADDFATGFTAFRQRYPDVTTIAPWNEPNNIDSDDYPLSADPALAAQYFLRAQTICPGCTLVAGDFAGIPGNDAYVDAYQAALGTAVPAVWAFHAHSDINAFQAGGPDSARIARYYIGKFQGQWGNARIWIDEIGAYYRDSDGIVWGDDSQAQATRFLLGLSTLDPRIDQIYYYNYANRCSASAPVTCPVQDRGLVSPSPFDGTSLDYDGSNRPRTAYNVIANRGPMIPPAAPVPPVVTITTPVQSAAINTRTPTFAGQAATGGRAEPLVTLQIFPGVSATESSAPLQTLTAPLVNGAWSVRSGLLPDGAYTARASQLGNRSSSGISQDLVFTIDTVKPTATVATAPPAQTGARTATFAFTASDPGSTFTCSLDRAAYTPCPSPLRLRRLRLGTHTLRVRAVDPAGNVQARPTIRSWRVVSLASALLPRTGELASALAGGLPLTAACADSCRIDARVYVTRSTASLTGMAGRRVSSRDPARPAKSSGYLTVGSGALVRTRAGTGTLALRLRAASRAALRATQSVTVRVGISLHPKGSKPTAVSRLVTLVRAGSLTSLARSGLPASVACSSACSARTVLWIPLASARALRAPGRSVAGGGRSGLPRGRYVSLGTATVSRPRGGVSDLTLPTPRTVRARLPRMRGLSLRTVARVSGPGTPASSLGWPLALPR